MLNKKPEFLQVTRVLTLDENINKFERIVYAAYAGMLKHSSLHYTSLLKTFRIFSFY